MSGTPGFYRLRSGSVRAIFEILEKQKEIWVRKLIIVEIFIKCVIVLGINVL